MLSYNLDRKPLGPCKSEPLKKLKSSCLQKTFTKRCTNNSLLSRDKTSLLELIGHIISISEYVLEKHLLLSILMKNTNMVSTPPIIMGGVNLKICQNFVGTKFFHIFVGG